MPSSPASPAAELTAHASFRRLAAATVQLAGEAGFGHVRVWRLKDGGPHWGQAAPWARVVWYPATGAPMLTVAHEVAHLLTPADDRHGPAWRSAFAALIPHLAEVVAQQV